MRRPGNPRAASPCTCSECTDERAADRARFRLIACTLAALFIWAAILFLSIGE